MLFVDWNFQKKGYGKKLMEYWETEMKNQGIKSIRYDSSGNGIIKVSGVKAHKYFTYDFKPMLKEIKSWK